MSVLITPSGSAMLGRMEVQLRDYRISPGRMDEWIAGWKATVVPLRRSAGFTVVGAWADQQQDRFIWLLGYEGPDGFSAADERYYGSHQRRSLDPDPARFVIEAAHIMVQTIL